MSELGEWENRIRNGSYTYAVAKAILDLWLYSTNVHNGAICTWIRSMRVRSTVNRAALSWPKSTAVCC